MKPEMYDNYTPSRVSALPDAENRRPNADHQAFGTRGLPSTIDPALAGDG